MMCFCCATLGRVRQITFFLGRFWGPFAASGGEQAVGDDRDSVLGDRMRKQGRAWDLHEGEQVSSVDNKKHHSQVTVYLRLLEHLIYIFTINYIYIMQQ